MSPRLVCGRCGGDGAHPGERRLLIPPRPPSLMRRRPGPCQAAATKLPDPTLRHRPTSNLHETVLYCPVLLSGGFGTERCSPLRGLSPGRACARASPIFATVLGRGDVLRQASVAADRVGTPASNALGATCSPGLLFPGSKRERPNFIANTPSASRCPAAPRVLHRGFSGSPRFLWPLAGLVRFAGGLPGALTCVVPSGNA